MTIEDISIIANIILTLLIFFQWDRGHAKEQATKNNVLSTRMMVGRIKDDSAENILSSIDSTLATLDARSPFIEQSKVILGDIRRKFKKEETAPLINAEKVSQIS